MSFANKVVLVTGSSGGIGAAIAIQFAKEGADVVLVGRNEEKLKNVEQQCEQNGKKPLVIKADVSNDDDAKSIVKQTIDKYGKLDILVNNAGIMRPGTILNGKILETYDVIMKTNTRAVIHLTTLAAPYLVQTKGNIINISSIASLRTLKNTEYLSYSISKAALDHFTRGAALELSASGVRVNSINPGLVRTDIMTTSGYPGDDAFWDMLKKETALGKVGEPEEIADLTLFLASDKARSITGSVYVSDNGSLLSN